MAYTFNPVIEISEGYGLMLCAGPFAYVVINHETVGHEGEVGCPAMIKPKGLLGRP
jgi:hypothetical protein